MSNGKITIDRPIEPLTRVTGRRLLKAINSTQYLDPDAIFVECILATEEVAGSGWCMRPHPEGLLVDGTTLLSGDITSVSRVTGSWYVEGQDAGAAGAWFATAVPVGARIDTTCIF